MSYLFRRANITFADKDFKFKSDGLVDFSLDYEMIKKKVRDYARMHPQAPFCEIQKISLVHHQKEFCLETQYEKLLHALKSDYDLLNKSTHEIHLKVSFFEFISALLLNLFQVAVSIVAEKNSENTMKPMVEKPKRSDSNSRPKIFENQENRRPSSPSIHKLSISSPARTPLVPSRQSPNRRASPSTKATNKTPAKFEFPLVPSTFNKVAKVEDIQVTVDEKKNELTIIESVEEVKEVLKIVEVEPAIVEDKVSQSLSQVFENIKIFDENDDASNSSENDSDAEVDEDEIQQKPNQVSEPDDPAISETWKSIGTDKPKQDSKRKSISHSRIRQSIIPFSNNSTMIPFAPLQCIEENQEEIREVVDLVDSDNDDDDGYETTGEGDVNDIARNSEEEIQNKDSEETEIEIISDNVVDIKKTIKSNKVLKSQTPVKEKPKGNSFIHYVIYSFIM